MSEETPARPVPEKLVERPHPLTPLVRGWIILVAVLWGFGRDLLPDGSGRPRELPPFSWLGIGVGAVILLSMVAGFFEWRFTRFVIDAAELRIEKGALNKTSERIRFDRIQSVDITQPFAARLLGLAELSIDVGAQGGTKLRYLTRQRAAALRDYLLVRAHGVRTAAGPADSSDASVLDDLNATDEVLIRVPPQRLVLGALLSHEFWLIALPFVLIGGSALLLDHAAAAAVRANPWVLLGGAVPVLGSLWGFVVRRVTGQWNYTLARSGRGLKITRGLTSLTSQSVPRHRVQTLRIVQPIGWRPLGLYRVDLAVLGMRGVTSDDDQAGRNSILLPIGTRDQVRLAVNEVWPGADLGGIQITSAPRRARRLDPLAWRWLGFGLDERVTVCRTGWLSREQSIVPHARLQSWRLTSGPLRRALNLADVELHVAGQGWASAIHHADAATARAFVLAQAERCRRARTTDVLAAMPEPPGPSTPS